MIDNLVFSRLTDTAEHHALFRDSVKKLAGRFGRKYFQDLVRRDARPTELWKELGAAGFLGVLIGEEHGGGGGTLQDYSLVIEEVAAEGCPMMALVILAICAPIIENHGSKELKEQWLPGLADGSLRMVFAITEPNAGSNTHRISTTAVENNCGWLLKGAKYWTSDLDEADAVLVVARDGEPDERGRHPLSLFVVDANAPGIKKQAIGSAIQAPEKQFMVFFDDVQIGPSSLIGERGHGLKHVFDGLNAERVSAAATSNGIARFALEKAASYSTTRSVWTTPIGAHQGLSHPLAEAYIRVQLARLMTARAAQLLDTGKDAGEAANMAKFAAADASLLALDQAIQIHGGNGFALEYGLADLWFFARFLKTAPVSREMILNYISQHSLQLPRSY